MVQVEWSVLSGEQVETVLANLLYSERRNATRIRPSQGDNGIDVLDPCEDDPTVADVYQIKKYATNLTSRQKSSIAESFRRVLIAIAKKRAVVRHWYIVLPLDPTLEERTWFAEMPDKVIAELLADEKVGLTEDEKNVISVWRDGHGQHLHWKGRLFCDDLAARYPAVIDYYLRNGSERLRSALDEVAKILGVDQALRSAAADSTSPLAPGEMRDHLRTLQSVLDGDPHFRYGISLDPVIPQIVDEPSLLAATQEAAADGTCLTFRIYARFAESLNERPIPIKVSFIAEPGSDAEAEIKDWLKYGRPLTAATNIEADLPGGLGGKLENGTTTIRSLDHEVFERRYRVVDPRREALAEISLEFTKTIGLDRTGGWAGGTDRTGLLSVEVLSDLTASSASMHMTVGDLTGRQVTDVVSAVRFAVHFRHPNLLQIGHKHGPFHDVEVIPDDPDNAGYPAAFLRYIEALVTIQGTTETPIALPDVEMLHRDDLVAAIRAAALIEGRTLVGTWGPEQEIRANSSGEPIGAEHCEIQIIERLVVPVGVTEIVVGAVRTTLLSAVVTSDPGGTAIARPHSNNTAHRTIALEEPTPDPGRNPVRLRELPTVPEPPREW